MTVVPARSVDFGFPGEEVAAPIRQRWQAEVRRLIALMATHQSSYACSCAGVDITILPQVFSPAYFTDSEWFATEIAAVSAGRSLLDIGTGTGIVALLAAREGATVTATDINPLAVENARLNFSAHKVSIQALQGDVYKALPAGAMFDVIFWNHPFNLGTDPNEDLLSLCGFDYEYRGLRQYIEGAERHLAPGGRLLLGTSTFAELHRIVEFAAGVGLHLRILKRKQTPLQWQGTALTELRIVEFTPRD